MMLSTGAFIAPIFLENTMSSEENTAPEAEAKKKVKRLTATEWARAEVMWTTGDHTLEKLSDTFGITKQALTSHFKKHNVKKGSTQNKMREALERQLASKQAKSAVEEAQFIENTRVEHAKYVENISKRAMYLVGKCAQDNKKFETILNDLKALEVTSRILSNNYNTLEKIIGLDKKNDLDDDMPVLQVIEITADQIAAMRAAQRDEDAEMTPVLDEAEQSEADMLEQIKAEQNATGVQYEGEDDEDDDGGITDESGPPE